ncbi:hypothetical protein EVA_09988 [gut metagenome]|uniref:DUF4296 domain-containing protein n=1 Tax=gut metagenome TaxID=749906 RepID=J9GPL0_9ZZZZ
MLGASLLVGCGKQIPKDIIQPEQMEQVLYDYHLSLAMGSNLSYEENYQKQAYKDYVFAKHGITSAEFDSSMVWYTRHTEELANLYRKLGDRFRTEKKQMQVLLALRENRSVISAPGDTVDIWYNRKVYWLKDAPLAHRIMFEIPADSNFHPKDRFVWSADYAFLSPGRSEATMGFNVLFDNDSVMGQVVRFTQSGPQQLVLQSDSAYAIKKVSGFIYYATQDSTQNDAGLVINGVTLMRYHALPADSLAANPVDGAEKALDNQAAPSAVSVESRSLQPRSSGHKQLMESNQQRQ